MALSSRTKKIVEISLADRKAAAELSAAVDANGSGPAAHVIAIPASTNIPVAVASLTPDALVADVNTAIAVVESRLDTLETKVNAIIAALIAAGMMA